MPKGMEIVLCIASLILLRFARGRVLAMMAVRYACNRCKDTGTIWNGSELVRCPNCR